MDIAILKEFVTLLNYRSAARAAKELHMAPSSLSRHMRSLEQELGVTLLEHGNRTRFTQEALAIAPAIVDTVKSYDAIFEAVPRAGSSTKPFMVHCVQNDMVCQDIISSAFDQLQGVAGTRYVETSMADKLLDEQLLDGTIDAVFGPPVLSSKPDALDYRIILHNPMFVCINRDSDLARDVGDSDSAPLEALSGWVLPVVVDSRLRVGYESQIDMLVNAGVGIKTEPVFVSTTREYYTKIEGNRFFVLGPRSLGIVPTFILQRFRIVRIDDDRVNANYVLSVRSGEKSTAFLRLADALEKAAAQYAGF